VARLFSSVATGERKDASGNIKEVPRTESIGRFTESKLNPHVGWMWSFLRGKNFMGEPFEVTNESAQRLAPLYLQDIYDAVKNSDDPVIEGLKTVPAFYGMGIGTYKSKPKAPKKQ